MKRLVLPFALLATMARAAEPAGTWSLETACPDGSREHGTLVLHADGRGSATLTGQAALAARAWTYANDAEAVHLELSATGFHRSFVLRQDAPGHMEGTFARHYWWGTADCAVAAVRN